MNSLRTIIISALPRLSDQGLEELQQAVARQQIAIEKLEELQRGNRGEQKATLDAVGNAGIP